jgi:hypothetical protein
VAVRLGFAGASFPLALAGGLLVSATEFRGLFLSGLAARSLRTDPVALVEEPAEGALRLAARLVDQAPGIASPVG